MGFSYRCILNYFFWLIYFLILTAGELEQTTSMQNEHANKPKEANKSKNKVILFCRFLY